MGRVLPRARLPAAPTIPSRRAHPRAHHVRRLPRPANPAPPPHPLVPALARQAPQRTDAARLRESRGAEHPRGEHRRRGARAARNPQDHRRRAALWWRLQRGRSRRVRHRQQRRDRLLPMGPCEARGGQTGRRRGGAVGRHAADSPDAVDLVLTGATCVRGDLLLRV